MPSSSSSTTLTNPKSLDALKQDRVQMNSEVVRAEFNAVLTRQRAVEQNRIHLQVSTANGISNGSTSASHECEGDDACHAPWPETASTPGSAVEMPRRSSPPQTQACEKEQARPHYPSRFWQQSAAPLACVGARRTSGLQSGTRCLQSDLIYPTWLAHTPTPCTLGQASSDPCTHGSAGQ